MEPEASSDGGLELDEDSEAFLSEDDFVPSSAQTQRRGGGTASKRATSGKGRKGSRATTQVAKFRGHGNAPVVDEGDVCL